MIICPRCKTANDSERTTCHSCGANLLPGKKLSDRLGCLVGALVSGAVFVATAVLLIVGIQRSGVGGLLSSGCQMPAMIIGIGFLALAGLAYGLYESLRPVPDHEKYHTRASQQLEDNPEQALADFSRAIELAPERGRGPYLRDRAAALGKLGRTEEALADLTRAIELTPEAEHGGYLEQRASLYEQLGRTKEATADLRTYLDHVERTIPGTKGGQRANLLKVRAELLEKLGRYAEAAQQLEDYLQAPDAEVSEGASLLGNILPVDRDAFLDTFKADGVKSVEARIEKLRRDALATGELAAVGYCERCGRSVVPGADGKCPHCSGDLARHEYVASTAIGAAAARLKEDAEQTARKTRRFRRTVRMAILAALLLCVLVPLAAYLLTPRPSPESKPAVGPAATATRQTVSVLATPTSEARVFRDDLFSFPYPGDWRIIDDEAIRILLATSLADLGQDGYTYLGGVYTGGLEPREGCASIVLVVLRDRRFEGQLTDGTLESLKAESTQSLGSRLLSFRRTDVNGMPAVETVYLGADRKSQMQSLTIIPQEKGLAYSITCSAHLLEYDRFAPTFEAALSGLSIAAPAEPPPQRTYVVQAGDTLGGIATQFGVTLEALAQANGISDPNRIQLGQVLTIP